MHLGTAINSDTTPVRAISVQREWLLQIFSTDEAVRKEHEWRDHKLDLQYPPTMLVQMSQTGAGGDARAGKIVGVCTFDKPTQHETWNGGALPHKGYKWAYKLSDARTFSVPFTFPGQTTAYVPKPQVRHAVRMGLLAEAEAELERATAPGPVRLLLPGPSRDTQPPATV